MKRRFYWIGLLLLLLIGGWWLVHSDRYILWFMGLDPTNMEVRRVQGKDGYMMVYSNSETEVSIAYSSVTWVSVTRMKPKRERDPL